VHEESYFQLGRRLEMKDQALAYNVETDPAKSKLQADLDEVIRSLEEAAQEIEKIDWEHGGMAGNDR